MTTGVTFRRAEGHDLRPAFAVFRRSIYDYLFRVALIDAEAVANASVDEAWQRQAPWIEHLWSTAAENWVAEGNDGNVLGWALSVEREGHLELTHFFVEPGLQSKGIGKGLIERAFPTGRGLNKSIAATQDPRALGLYLRSGVSYLTTVVEFVLTPARRETPADFTVRAVEKSAEGIESIARIEKRILGFRRDADILFLLGQRQAWLAMRGGESVGFAFGVQKETGASGFPALSGPMAALDPADMPALIDHVAGEAASSGAGEFSVLAPFINRQAVSHLLGRGAKIDPFYMMILANGDGMKLDRWLHTGPTFIL